MLFSLPQGVTGPVIRARASTSNDWFELIPHFRLVSDLPNPLLDSFAHWMNKTTGDVEFRPLHAPWDSNTSHWFMRLSDGFEYTLRREENILIDVASKTANMIMGAFQYIESISNTVLYTSALNQLEVELPRYRLAFSLEDNSIVSRSHPGFKVDRDRNFGAFIGLHSQLVLKPVSAVSGLSRRLIVPLGEYNISPSQGHVMVQINTEGVSHVKYQEYESDSLLCRVVGDGSLFSRLIRVYLHAVTSSSLPDPLTGMTGTETAMMELSSPGCLSFQKLDVAEQEVLHLIRALTPYRTWYPDHLRLMEQVEWSQSLPSMVQHDAFDLRVSAIFQHANRLALFSKNEPISYSPNPPESHLYLRAAARRAGAYIKDLHDQTQSPPDALYVPIDQPSAFSLTPSRESQVAGISTMIMGGYNRFPTTPDLLDIAKKWGRISECARVDMTYSSSWHQPELSEIWLGVYRSCQDANPASMLFSLSALAYTSPNQLRLIPTILAIAASPSFHPLAPPTWDRPTVYNLDDGSNPILKDLVLIIKCNASFEGSSYDNLTFTPTEPAKSRARRIQTARSEFSNALDLQARLFSKNLIHQWPCETPSTPQPPGVSGFLFQASAVMEQIRSKFRSWYQNLCLLKHLAQVQSVLNCMSVGASPIVSASEYFVPALTTSPGEGIQVQHPSLSSLLSLRRAPELPPPPPPLLGDVASSDEPPGRTSHSQLGHLISVTLDAPTGSVQKRYGDDLEASYQAMLRESHVIQAERPIESLYSSHQRECTQHVEECLRIIRLSLSPDGTACQFMQADIWPRLTLPTLVGQLAFPARNELEPAWATCFTNLTRSALMLQRAQRLLNLNNLGDILSLDKELSTLVPKAGNVENDWLLIQVCISLAY